MRPAAREIVATMPPEVNALDEFGEDRLRAADGSAWYDKLARCGMTGCGPPQRAPVKSR